MQSAEAVLDVLRERGRRGLPCEELYRQLFNPRLFLLAHGRIYSNHGAMTPGACGETADGMSLAKIGHIIDALRHERYRFQPVKRVYIPKKSGKMRPLGLPSWSDKLIGEVMRLLLEAYYEPTFSGRSHGFRPGRGCHTALNDIAVSWTGTTWFIEGDISDCFGSLDHEIMVSILAEKIHDNRFLRLIKQMLQAGYLEDWEYHETLSGCPQGGVVSPVLSNIYLDRLDRFAETVLIPQYTRGTGRAPSPAYRDVKNAMRRARTRGDRAAVRELRQQLRALPSGDPGDPGFRRLRYARYADDHILGFTGPKAEAEEIKARLAQFLRDDLKLELSQEKTLITHARSGAARFLSYEITVQHSRDRPQVNGVIRLRVPAAVIKAKCAPYLAHGQPERRTALINLSDLLYHQHLRRRVPGHHRVRPPACDVFRLNRLEWVASTSMLKTLAAKHGSTVTKMARKYKAKIATPHGPRTCFEASTERGRQETTGRQVRRYPADPAEESGPHRPRARPGPLAARSSQPGSSQRPVRMVRATRPGGNPPGPQARRPRQAGTAAARVGAPHGHHAQEDARGLHSCHQAIHAGQPAAASTQ